MRWVGKTLEDGPTFLLEAGGVGTLSYEHKSIDEPAILLGGSFMVDLVENSAEDEKEGGRVGNRGWNFGGMCRCGVKDVGKGCI